ncbi:MAG: hypothetical protein AW12_02204 [Candidatus Accumulibacter sp. BA-94]|nr:MAG: hypothetical protein AW12_02204 [Candidatus Accumulibacter sp. BA-94]
MLPAARSPVCSQEPSPQARRPHRRRLGSPAWRLSLRRRLSFGQRLHRCTQLNDAPRETFDVLLAGNTEAAQRARNPVLEDLLDLEDLLEPVPGTSGLAGHLRDPLIGHLARPRLDALAFLDQRFEHLAAFFLRLGKGAKPRQPDLLRRFLDGRRQLVLAHATSQFLEFLAHFSLLKDDNQEVNKFFACPE